MDSACFERAALYRDVPFGAPLFALLRTVSVDFPSDLLPMASEGGPIGKIVVLMM